MTDIPAVPQQFELVAALNRALFAEAAVKSQAAVLAQEEEKRKEAINSLEVLLLAHNMRGITSNLGSADIVDVTVYNVEDWKPLWDHIRATGEFDLLYKRVTQKAVQDRDSNNALPPGIRRVVLPKIKLTVGK